MRTDESLQVWAGLLHAHAALTRAIETELRRRHDLALSAFEVLARLAEGPGVRMQQLADGAMLSKSGLTRLIDRLEEGGLVRRCPCPSDRRGTVAELTPAGRRVLKEALPGVAEAVQRHFVTHLSPEEAEILLRAFRKVLAAHHSEAGLDACGGSASA